MIGYKKKFTLKVKCFISGKMLSPPRSEWIQCDCCNKWIVQGVELSNGDKIGNNCYELFDRVINKNDQDALKQYNDWGTPVIVRQYMNNLRNMNNG